MELFLRPIPRLAVRLVDWDDLLKALMGDRDCRIKVWDVVELEHEGRWNRVSVGEFCFDSWAFPFHGSIKPGVYRIVGQNKTRFMRMVVVAILALRHDVPFPGKATVPSPEAILGPTRIECGGVVLIDGETEEADGEIIT